MKYSVGVLRVVLFLLLVTILNAKNAPYSYSYTPKYVYQDQIFPVTIQVKHYDAKNPPNFEYEIVAPLQPIDPLPTKLINRDEAFFTFYFKADTQNKTITIPQLSIWNLKYTYMLHPKTIKVKDLIIERDNFSKLIASNLRVNGIKISPFDSKSQLVTLKLEATEANLEDFQIPSVTDDGVENIKRDGARVIEDYYFIVPSSKKSINFSYYNLMKNSFLDKNISLKGRNSMQNSNELKPKDLSFEKIKMYLFIGLSVLFLILFIFTKDILYIIIVAALIAVGIYMYYPKAKICIQEGASIYILPTSNSNISQRVDKQIESRVIKRYKTFNKIEYKQYIIGWVKDEDLCKI